MKKVAIYNYKNEDGQTIGVVHRLHSEKPEKPSKSFIPYFKLDDKGQLIKGIPEEMKGLIPLYGLCSVLDKSLPVYIVEGEKSASALHSLGFQAVTSQGGSNAIHSSDWNFLNDCQQLYILPDFDDAGEKYAEQAYKKIITKNCHLIRLPHVDKGDDICDVISNKFPQLNWDEIAPLNNYENHAEIKVFIEGLFQQHKIEIPIEWKVVFTKANLPAISIYDFQRMPIVKREAYLAPWLTSSSINMVFAARGLGKTFFSLSCAIAVAEGEEVMGYKASKAVPVLYLDGEMQSPLLQERFHLLRNGNKENIPFHLVTPDLLKERVMPDLASSEGQADIDELIEKLAIKVLFIDNLSTLVRTGKENESESWLPLQTWLIGLRAKGLAIVIVHHANKNGGQRGTSRKEDIMDNVISLKHPDDYEEHQGARFLVEYTKARSLSGEESQAFETHLISSNDITKWVVSKVASKKDRAIEMKSMGMNARDIAVTLEVDVSTVHRYLKGLDFKKIQK